MKEIKNDLISVKNDLSSLNKTVSDLSGDLEDYKQQTASELAGLTSALAGLQSNVTSEPAGLTSELGGLQSNVTSEPAGLTSELARLQSNVTSELAGIQSNMTSELAGLHTTLQLNTQQLTKLCTKVDKLDIKLVSVNDSMNRISDNVESHDNHVTTELMELDQNLQQNFSLQLNNSFGYIYPVYTCGGTGGWRRVVYLNFTGPNTTCPSGWQLTSFSKRTCGRVSTGCNSVTFPVSGGDYTRVCGRIIGYQDRTTTAFKYYNTGHVTTIDDPYVEGVSLTHGSPRQHIWTFAAGAAENTGYSPHFVVCPCDTTLNITIPPFVGGDYFCESGAHPGDPYGFYPDDPLWDGDGCTAASTCCSFNNPPYFTKQLPSPTIDDIEARLCRNPNNRDMPIEFIELYVQ